MILELVLIFMAAGGEDQDPGCLRSEWAEIASPPSFEQRQFDLQNDFDADGDRYSCNGYTTPTEIASLLEALKRGLENGNNRFVSGLLRYPFNIFTDQTRVTKEGHLQQISYEIKNAEEFNQRYNEIITPTLRQVIMCADLSNLSVHPYKGLSIAFGSIWINRNTSSRQLLLVSIGQFEDAQKKWLAANCAS